MKAIRRSAISGLLTLGLVLALQTAARGETDSTTTERGSLAAVRKPRVRVTVRDIGPQGGASFGNSGFVFHREDPQQIILPTVGRVFRSFNGGREWHPLDLLTDGGQRIGAFFVRQDPANPNVLFAWGSGGLYRSTDFGTSWTSIDEDFFHNPMADVAVLETSSNVVLALLGSAFEEAVLWKSVDGGLTFDPRPDSGLPRTLTDPETGELIALPFFESIVTAPANPAVVYVVQSFDETGYYPPSVYKSVDGGETFARLDAAPPTPLRVFAHPTRPDVLFVTDGIGTGTGIHRSTDGGISFQQLAATPGGWVIAFDAHNPSFVYVTGGRAGEGLFRSTDDGETFQPLGLTAEQVGSVVEQVSVDPTDPDVIYVNTERGNFKSVNGGRRFRAINDGWRADVIHHIALDGDDHPGLYVSTEGKGILKTKTRGRRYEEVPNTAGGHSPTVIAIAPTDPELILAGTLFGGLFRTADGGRTWTRANVDTGIIRFERELSEIAFDPLDSNNVYFAATTHPIERSGFYRSTDAGATFQRTESFPGDPRVRNLAVDPIHPNVICVGNTQFSGPMRSVDGGLSFAGGPILQVHIDDVAIDPTDSNNVYLAGAFNLVDFSAVHRVVRSTDGGATYAASDAGLTGLPYGMVIDPKRPNRLYAWMTTGLFMTRDRGTTWTLLEGDETVKAAGFFDGRTMVIHPKKPNLLYLSSGSVVLEVEIRE
jgi:photosystem II stability/assembly factor-like uncharacterized protein